MGRTGHNHPRVGQLAVQTDPSQIAGRNYQRASLAVLNTGPATVYLGFTAGVSIVTGFALPVGIGIVTDIPLELYVIAAATGSIVSYIEQSR